MPVLSIGSMSLSYEVQGAHGAPALILAHGLGGNKDLWQGQMDALARTMRVLRYDLRGHGDCSPCAAPFDLPRLGQDVLALADAHEIDRFSFCGLSMGAQVGMWLGVNASHRLNRLVLANTAARLGTPEAWTARIEMARSSGLAAIAQGMAARAFTERFKAASPEVVSAVRDVIAGTPVEGFIASCAALRDADLRSDLHRITTPTLVITGEEDAITPPADGQALASLIPGAVLRSLPTGHLSCQENAQAFNEILLDFLDRKA